MAVPALRVVVDGDSNKVYRKGEKVTGRVTLAVEEQEQIESLKVVLAGNSITKTSRPFRINAKNDNAPLRRDYEEKIRLFHREIGLVSRLTLSPKKYSWTFELAFPELTEQKCKQLFHGANYLRESHPLPPTFQLKTSALGGAAHISYFVQARIVFTDSKGTKKCKHLLRYQPTPPGVVSREARATATLLYDQIWKPTKGKENTRVAVNKVFSRRPTNINPRIIPCLSHPQSIAPGQHIPLSLSLLNTRDPLNEAKEECTLDSLSVTISTYSTSMCGHTATDPEDVVSRHVSCIARTDINQPLAFGQTKTLTSNFRLVDDVECVPSFRTYTITRRYDLSVSIGIKYNDQHFTIKSTTPLEILPRTSRELQPPSFDEGDDIDPLPLYAPREPSREFAPDYESIYALPRTTSSDNSLSRSRSRSSRSSSFFSRGSALSSAVSMPVMEIEQPIFERVMEQTT
ncbi:Nn.00g017040.m01.CDS01 [Neocucurbitaria sp. VM-36]